MLGFIWIDSSLLIAPGNESPQVLPPQTNLALKLLITRTMQLWFPHSYFHFYKWNKLVFENCITVKINMDSPGGTSVKEPACQCRRHERHGLRSLGWKDPQEKGMATHSSILAWRISWMEELGGLQSISLHRVRYNWSDLACNMYVVMSHCGFNLHLPDG